jgi:NAD(P)-dependent dehydrogenase (short-subunit alcohol dehydrogenase family)
MQRKVLITGCRPGGIGEATAREFAVTHQDDVLVCDLHRDLVAQSVEQLRNEGGRVQFVEADVTRPDDVQRLINEAGRLWGRIDVLVNNCGDAGDPRRDNLRDLTLDDFESILRANLGTAFLVTKSVFERFMVPQRSGVAVFLGSTNGQFGSLGQLSYSCAKAAVAAMVRVLCVEYARQNVRVLLAQPGIIRTRGKNWQRREHEDPAWAEKEGQMNPTGRVGRPAEVAKAIAFLASDDASFLNGAAVPIDGGLLASGIRVPGIEPGSDFRESYVRAVTRLRQLDQTDRQAA